MNTNRGKKLVEKIEELVVFIIRDECDKSEHLGYTIARRKTKDELEDLIENLLRKE